LPFAAVPLSKEQTAEARRLLATHETNPAKSPDQLRNTLTNLLGGFPTATDLRLKITTNQNATAREIAFSPENGLTLKARHQFGKNPNRLLILLDLPELLGVGPLGEAAPELRRLLTFNH